MLPFFFRHYDPLVERYVVYDDGSTDNSLEILRSHAKVDLRPMPPYDRPDSRVASNIVLQDHCWMESRGAADWVIVTDVDEHVYHPQLEQYLWESHEQGVTIIPALGYQMLADEFPSSDLVLCRTLTMGAPWWVLNKVNVFSPDAVTATNYGVGRHNAVPKGRVRAPGRDELLLLHYKYLDFEYVLRRYAQYQTRQRPTDDAKGWGAEYSWSRRQLRESWDWFANRLVDVSRPDLNPGATRFDHRWWDAYPRVSRSFVDRIGQSAQRWRRKVRSRMAPQDEHP